MCTMLVHVDSSLWAWSVLTAEREVSASPVLSVHLPLSPKLTFDVTHSTYGVHN